MAIEWVRTILKSHKVIRKKVVMEVSLSKVADIRKRGFDMHKIFRTVFLQKTLAFVKPWCVEVAVKKICYNDSCKAAAIFLKEPKRKFLFCWKNWRQKIFKIFKLLLRPLWLCGHWGNYVYIEHKIDVKKLSLNTFFQKPQKVTY